MALRGPAVVGAISVAGTLVAGDSVACSVPDNATELLSPRRREGAPLDTQVRISLEDALAPGARVVLRERDSRREIPVKSRPLVGYERHALVPAAPLAPSTLYEVAVIDPNEHPSTFVFGAFKTASALDKTPPVLGPLGNVKFKKTGCFRGIEVHVGVTASDPGRPDAELWSVVWKTDATGRVDSTRPPDMLERLHDRTVLVLSPDHVGGSALDFERKAPLDLAIAVVDESGNQSAMQRLHLDIP